MTFNKITVTDGRLNKALQRKIEPIIVPQVSQKIDKAQKDSKIQTGKMSKFYQHLDKCEVELQNGGKVICKILHRYCGELLDFYTPRGDEAYCDKLHEPCIIPMQEIECLVLDVNDDSDEQIVIGYIISDEIIGMNPAGAGNAKFSFSNGINEFWVKFGDDGLDFRLPEKFVTNVGEMDEDMTPVDYVSSDTIDELAIVALGLGRFKINNEGVLLVELPNNMSNIFKIEDGCLWVDLPAGADNDYVLKSDGCLYYERKEF